MGDPTFDGMPDLNPQSGRITDRLMSKTTRKNRQRNAKRQRKLQQQLQQQHSRPLPVHNHTNDVVKAVGENQVVVITAETGCGKSSQVPQMLLRKKLNEKGTIVCTQPRRVAARELAIRVAKEMNVTCGLEVGYHVRFENHTNSKRTVIKYMTDGILLRECLFNAEHLEKYSIIIIDEVHERTTQMDLLFGFMKQILPKRPKLKLVIMSATMNTDSVSEFFDNAPVLKLEGSLTHHVDMLYDPGHTNEHVLKVIRKILDGNKKGDILVFLPGIPEIQQLKESLRGTKGIWIFVAHSQVPRWEMDKIFLPAPNDQRKVILSTNVTESSVTIEGLRFVVDTGYVNVKVFNHQTGVNVLETRLISESEAQQRRGRVGRTAPGFCYRLYRIDQLKGEVKPEDDADKPPTERRFKAFPEPQIERDDLTHVVLMLKQKGFREVAKFPWITNPKAENVEAAITDLCRLGALKHQTFDLTEFGKKMVKFPLHPLMAAAVLKSTKYGCEYGALLLAAILSVFNGGRQRSLKRLAEPKYERKSDEVEVFMNIMQEFKDVVKDENLGQAEVNQFAWRSKISHYYIYEAVHVYDQLLSILIECRYRPRTPDLGLSAAEADVIFDVQPVLKEIFATNVGRKEEGENDFKLPNGVRVKFQPTLVTTASRSVLRSVGGIELFCLSDIRGQRRDLSPRMVNTFIPVNDLAD